MYTSMPILLLSLTEKPYNETKLMSTPELYKKNAGNKRLTWKHFIGWIALSIYHSLVVYTFGYMIWNTNDAIFQSPYTVDLCAFSTFMIHNVVFVVTIKLWLLARYQTFAFILTIFGSILGFMASTVFYNFFNLWDRGMLWVYNYLITSASFWSANILICVAALLPDYVIIALKMLNIKFRPTDTIAIGWNRLFRKPKNHFKRKPNTNNIRESTYL